MLSITATSFIDAGHHAAKLLGNPALVGMALIEGYLSGTPWLTPQQAAFRAKVSDDTARRRLEELAAIGRVETRTLASARKIYMIHPKIAESVMARLTESGSSASPPRAKPAHAGAISINHWD